MKIWRLIKYLIALSSIIIILMTPLLGYFKREFIDTYNVRWHQELKGRTQVIEIRNEGDATSPIINVELNIPQNTQKSISDFSFSPLKATPGTSFLELSTHSRSFTDIANNNKDLILPVIDEHSGIDTLYSVDQSLNAILAAKLGVTQVNGTLGPNLKKHLEQHKASLEKCKENIKAVECKQSRLLSEWEYSRCCLRSEACRGWQAATGVQIMLPDNNLSSSGKIRFALSLMPKESGYLHINYGPNPITPIATLTSNVGEKVLRVNDVSDLRTPPFLMATKRNLLVTILFLAFLVILVWNFWRWFIPVKLLPTYQIYNLALITDDSDFWEQAYQNHRFHMISRFRRLCNDAQVNHPGLFPEEVFNYIKDRLKDDYKKKSVLFSSEYVDNNHLSARTDEYLRDLVDNT